MGPFLAKPESSKKGKSGGTGKKWGNQAIYAGLAALGVAVFMGTLPLMSAIMPALILGAFLKSPKLGMIGLAGYGGLWALAMFL